MKTIVKLCSALCLAAGFLGGSVFYQNQKTITLEFAMFAGSNWDVANADSYAIVDQVIARFEEEHPGVKVHYTSGIRKEDYSEWFAQKVLRGEAPDVALVLSEDFYQMVSLGIFMDLQELMDGDDGFFVEKYYGTALEAGLVKRVPYALPYEVVPKLMCVNKTLLMEEGYEIPDSAWTWTEFYALCKSITKDKHGDGFIDQFGVCNYTWRDAAYANGAPLFNEEGTVAYLDDMRVIQSVKFVKQLEELSGGQSVSQKDFEAGNVAFMPLSYAEYRTYKRYPYRINRYSNFQWDCITAPAGTEGGNTSEVSSLLMGICADTKKRDLAWDLLKLFTYHEEFQMKIFSDSQGASVLRAVTNSPEAQLILQEDMEADEKSIDNKRLGTVIEQGAVMPKFQKYEEVMVLIDSKVKTILDEDKDIDSAMKILQRDIKKFLLK